jgi:hypothetical protein
VNQLCKTQGISCKTGVDRKAKNLEKTTTADVAELVDARDLKSLDGNVVRVRFPPSAPVTNERYSDGYLKIFPRSRRPSTIRMISTTRTMPSSVSGSVR